MTGVEGASAPGAEVASRDELVGALRERAGRAIRLIGSGSGQHRLPPAGTPVEVVSLGGLRRILRLDPQDLTCSIEAGVRRDELDAALTAKGMWLPCRGRGTAGGIFATGYHAPAAPGALSPRSLLLGLEGVLAEGLAFKSGARVVKSVAGFDLQKAFVGSRGRLLAATTLHLKLRPLPRAVLGFDRGPLERAAALALFAALRRESPPLLELYIERDASGYRVHGRLAGHAAAIGAQLRRHGLTECVHDAPDYLEAEPGSGLEVVAGGVRPRRVADLLDALPDDAAVRVNGSGQFEARLAPAQSDALLAAAPTLEARAEICGGEAARRGRATPIDAVAERLSQQLRRALDPGEMLR